MATPKKATRQADTALVGAAGEHLVLSRLLARGFLAAQAPRGTRKADILVNHIDGGAPYLIQVKARSKGKDRGWHMNEKHESQREADLFYCFVDFDAEHPFVYVVPSKVVADALAKGHKRWLQTPGKKGQPHNATTFRRLLPEADHMPKGWMNKYLEAWDLLSAREN
jgi:hypothetical protein